MFIIILIIIKICFENADTIKSIIHNIFPMAYTIDYRETIIIVKIYIIFNSFYNT